ncbi:hypothetical protein N9U74_01125 [Synechococcus sp. AH-736-M02]|nr:hypothetical protein [Synechococcus sp. AH-736-M02]
MGVELHDGLKPYFAEAWHDHVMILTRYCANCLSFFLWLEGELASSSLTLMSAIHGKLLPLQQKRRSSSASAHWCFSNRGVSTPRLGSNKLKWLFWSAERPPSSIKAPEMI